MPSLLTRVKSKMFVFAHRRARGMLDGEYASVFRGRSLDFDDLRAYIPGDEVRDIDWKASARVGAPLIKRYVAVRRQTVLLVADTGRNMAALARGGEVKKDIAVMALGVVGYLAVRHGDNVGLVHGDAGHTAARPAKGTEGHLEQLLQSVDAAATLEAGSSDLKTQLAHISRSYATRMLLFVVADELALDEETARLLRRLQAQHEILWVQIRDAELAGEHALALDSYDVADRQAIAAALGRDAEVARDYADAVAARSEATASFMAARGIVMAQIGHSSEVVGTLFSLLERHRRAR
ncbi:DUF58 domain-containing protein [Arthrobacter sp. 35W]|uniref:DUF58 domain-containing protein n=1 Tax=Arthrobacter sp. 35W TaxID=1132441 RepID=UPI00047EBA9B|nr:DUF58 domain-containing protein [Arthrobacter sp. 35W]